MSLAQLLLRLVSHEEHARHVAELRVDASSGGKQSAVQRLQVRARRRIPCPAASTPRPQQQLPPFAACATCPPRHALPAPTHPHTPHSPTPPHTRPPTPTPQALDGVLLRNIEVQRKYLMKLEGQKASDISAETSTKKIVMYGKQMELLSRVSRRACGRRPWGCWRAALVASALQAGPGALVARPCVGGSGAQRPPPPHTAHHRPCARAQVVERVSEVAHARGIEVPRMEIPSWVNTEDTTVPAGAEVMRCAARHAVPGCPARPCPRTPQPHSSPPQHLDP
jgi:hypothetical protein